LSKKFFLQHQKTKADSIRQEPRILSKYSYEPSEDTLS